MYSEHGVVFNQLYTLTNMPIQRFRESLERLGNYEVYLEKLAGAFNPAAAKGVMCRSLISVGYDERSTTVILIRCWICLSNWPNRANVPTSCTARLKLGSSVRLSLEITVLAAPRVRVHLVPAPLPEVIDAHLPDFAQPQSR